MSLVPQQKLRTRNFKYPEHPPVYWTGDGWKTKSSYKPAAAVMGKQRTVSEGHERNPRTGDFREGGPFYTCRTERKFPTTPYTRYNKNNPNEAVSCCIGTPMPPSTITTWSGIAPLGFRKEDTSDLDPYGATAISRCAPTNSSSDAGVAIGEILKDGIKRSLPGVSGWQHRTEKLKALGSEFLAAEFGWLPLVAEIKEVATSAQLARDILSQYARDEGKNIRRTYEFPIEKSASSTNLGNYYHSNEALGGFNFAFARKEPGVLTQTVETVTRRWFSGSFTYAIPSSGDAWERFGMHGSEADKLFGTTLTPTTLWELAPWSWAVDWFSNTGEVINNFTLFKQQGLVMRYGYMMEEKSTIVTHTIDRETLHGLRYAPASRLELVSKVRRPANPFGFGLAWEGLSPLQLAITAALGITRLR